MKVVLANNKEYAVSGVFQITDTQICIVFTEVTSYDDLRIELTETAMKQISYYPEIITAEVTGFTTETVTSNTFDVYENYINFAKSTVTVRSDNLLDVAMYFEKATDDQLRLTVLEDAVDTLILESLEV